jgi:hypothetical protein
MVRSSYKVYLVTIRDPAKVTSNEGFISTAVYVRNVDVLFCFPLASTNARKHVTPVCVGLAYFT